MSKLSDTQLVILSAALQRPDRQNLPLPERLKGGAAQNVITGLVSRGDGSTPITRRTLPP